MTRVPKKIVEPETETPIESGLLRGLLPSQITMEIIRLRVMDPEYNPQMGRDPDE